MTLTKRQKLEAGVVAAMSGASERVMEWGKDDCALWCADVINEALGYDPAAHNRGRYTTRRGAARVLGKKGMLGAMRAAARRHKWKRINPAMARPGDIGLLWTTTPVQRWVWETDDETLERRRVRVSTDVPVLATAICRASGWFVARNERGFTAVRAEHVAICWSVLDDHQPGSRASLGNPDGLRRPMAPIVCHEPVSLFILSALAIEATVTAIAITNAIIYATVSIGFSLASSLLQPQRGTSDSGSFGGNVTQGAQVTVRQSVPYKRVILGSAYVGGALFFEQIKAPYLYTGILIAYGEIDEIESARVGTDTLAFSSITPNSILTPLGIDGQPDYPAYLQTSLRYGETDQAVDQLILSGFPSIGTEFRQRGNATAVMRYHYGGTDNSLATQTNHTAVWGQVARPPSFFVVRGAKVYDPRDATQSLADSSTWKWSNNATLNQVHYLTAPWGGRIPTSKIDWDKIADSADYDDEVIACGDGMFIKRHTLDGVVTLNQRPFEVLPQLLTANRAMLLESGGRVWIESARPRTPTFTIHDRIIASGIKYQSAKEKRNLINKVQVRAVAPGQDYQTVDGPLLNDTALQATDQEVLTGTIDLNYTLDTSTNWTRVQRLQKAFLDSSRLGKTLTVSVDATLLGITSDELIGAVGTFDSVLFSAANRDYLVTAVGFSEDFTSIGLALTEYDPTIETSWNPTTDERPFTYTLPDVS